jgi:threonine/homoserine/homoserine lactone efflux protein
LCGIRLTAMDALLAISLLIGFGAITPGPNNAIVMAAGMRGGLKAAHPLIAGVLVGGLIMLAVAWTGSTSLLDRFPEFAIFVTSTGAAYLAWMGSRMIWQPVQFGTNANNVTVQSWAIPGTSLEMIMFQFANPKAWTLLLTITALAAHDFHGVIGFFTLAGIFAALSGASLFFWALAGTVITNLVTDAPGIRRIEYIMGAVFILLGVALALSVLK